VFNPKDLQLQDDENIEIYRDTLNEGERERSSSQISILTSRMLNMLKTIQNRISKTQITITSSYLKFPNPSLSPNASTTPSLSLSRIPDVVCELAHLLVHTNTCITAHRHQ
jgi:hypothetical protein